jgi:hypothetical protein
MRQAFWAVSDARLRELCDRGIPRDAVGLRRKLSAKGRVLQVRIKCAIIGGEGRQRPPATAERGGKLIHRAPRWAAPRWAALRPRAACAVRPAETVRAVRFTEIVGNLPGAAGAARVHGSDTGTGVPGLARHGSRGSVWISSGSADADRRKRKAESGKRKCGKQGTPRLQTAQGEGAGAQEPPGQGWGVTAIAVPGDIAPHPCGAIVPGGR